MVRALAGHVDLELRNDPRVLFIAQADADRRQVAGPVVLAEPVKILDHGRLELAVDERVEVLADRLVIVRADDHIRAAGAGLQARIERLAARAVRARRAERRAAADGGARQHVLAAVFSRWQLDAELYAKIVGPQKDPADPPPCLHDDSRRSESMREALTRN
ncbi:hypothetical protein WL21_17410 [Burkholderia ubonensis]|nr:hypothetical protein WJ81_04270 [Burkholderia ubonensis]KVZ61160.1 hypothetical protein WL20_16430 [Burkholderia ubonensis]KVZ66809.1 hypothetical protein WL21_17410 [Burkholderia ubonensis]KWO78698.1 hypothetical protein WM32_31105 [Burkholderia ubonensis]OJB19189.1 hypothetical protein BGV54_20030 [Burkholderia ubonensis]